MLVSGRYHGSNSKGRMASKDRTVADTTQPGLQPPRVGLRGGGVYGSRGLTVTVDGSHSSSRDGRRGRSIAAWISACATRPNRRGPGRSRCGRL